MRFMCLLYDQEPTGDTPEDAGIFEAYGAFDEQVTASGAYVHGEALEPSTTARSLRKTPEGVMVTDGPFLETREQLGGFYILECASREDAEAWAAKIPAAETGRVEVRQLAGHDPRLLEVVGKPRFMALIYGDESKFIPVGTDAHREIISGHRRFTEDCVARDSYVTGDGLYTSDTARTVAVRDGSVSVTDGPYAETREVLGGFYELACASIEEAVELARQLVWTDNGGIEVRPVMSMEMG